MKRQSGFTLVEIAIVLVVIGLLLGGVLKGQELVLNSRIRTAINEYNNVTSAMFAYQDRYRQIPGDDKTVTVRWPGGKVTEGNGNRVINGKWENDSKGSPDETAIFWHHLRNDGIINGAKDNTDDSAFSRPVNAFDGLTGIQDGSAGDVVDADGGLFICQSNIPFKAATIIDTRIDDGKGNAGGLRAGELTGDDSVALPATSAPYAANKNYALCREL